MGRGEGFRGPSRCWAAMAGSSTAQSSTKGAPREREREKESARETSGGVWVGICDSETPYPDARGPPAGDPPVGLHSGDIPEVKQVNVLPTKAD